MLYQERHGCAEQIRGGGSCTTEEIPAPEVWACFFFEHNYYDAARYYGGGGKSKVPAGVVKLAIDDRGNLCAAPARYPCERAPTAQHHAMAAPTADVATSSDEPKSRVGRRSPSHSNLLGALFYRYTTLGVSEPGVPLRVSE